MTAAARRRDWALHFFSPADVKLKLLGLCAGRKRTAGPIVGRHLDGRWRGSQQDRMHLRRRARDLSATVSLLRARFRANKCWPRPDARVDCGQRALEHSSASKIGPASR